MAQVIIYTNENGSVNVCIPTGELSIEEVKIKDTPANSIIIDDSQLPQGDDAMFIDAWELNGTTITFNIEKAKETYLKNYNVFANTAASTRALNNMTGIVNIPDDNTWLENVKTGRNLIATATTSTELLAIPFPTPTSET